MANGKIHVSYVTFCATGVYNLVISRPRQWRIVVISKLLSVP